MATSRVAWGIDVGNRALKAIKLVREAEGVRIDDFDVIEHESVLSNAGDNREGLIQTALATFVSRHTIKGLPVSVGVSGQQSFARFIKLPPVEPKKIPEIVRFEAIQQIPFPLDEVEWSYQLFQNDASPDVEVGIFAMRKDLVQEHIKFFTDAGLNVQVVQMNPLAVYNGMYFDDRLKGATTMIIDLGAENADLIITEGDSVWMRSIPIGGNHFTEALVKSFKLRFEKAEELKRNAATSKYGRQILQAMRPIFADLVSEIQRSIGFYSSVHRDSRISRVLALGGTFKLPGLQKYLQQNLTLDVVKIDGLGQAPPTDAKVGTALNENILSAVSAYGLALQGMGEAKINSSLLPQQIRREKMWREKTKWFALAAACFVGGTAIPAAMYFYKDYQFQQAKPIQTAIDNELKNGERLSVEWAGLESKGAPDRKQIGDVNSIIGHRELVQSISREMRSVPWTSAAPPKAGTRPEQDQRVILEDVQMQYEPNMGQIISADDQTFNQYAAKRDFAGTYNPGAGKRQATQNYGAPAGGRQVFFGGGNLPPPGPMPSGGGPIMPPGPGAVPSPMPAQDPNAAVAGDQRGFLITLHVVTPNPAGVNLIDSVVKQTLLKREAAAATAAAAATTGSPVKNTPARRFSIKRVTIPFAFRFWQNPERVTVLQERAAHAANPAVGFQMGNVPQPVGVPGAPVAPVAPPPAAVVVPAVPGPAGAALPPGMVMGPNGQVTVNPFIDPVTKEDVKDWFDVVVLVAVVVDPAPPPAPTPSP